MPTSSQNIQSLRRQLPKTGYLYRVEWRFSDREPPEGLARVQAEAFALSTRPEDRPPVIKAKMAELGLGTGWTVSVYFISPPAKRRSERSRAAQRTRNLTRRVEKTIGPMFAQEVIAASVAQNPAYYQGKRDPAHEARVARLDAQDAQRWDEYLRWWKAQPQGDAAPARREAA